MGEDARWLDERAWKQADAPVVHERERRDYLFFDVVVDQDLGAIAVARLPGGREFYGADGGQPPPSCGE